MDRRIDILAFGAHPDDVELGCGGTIVKEVKLGKSVGIIDLTRGELGTRGTPEIRKKEADDAAKIIGAKFRDNLCLTDAFIDTSKDSISKIVRKIRLHQPKIILHLEKNTKMIENLLNF